VDLINQLVFDAIGYGFAAVDPSAWLVLWLADHLGWWIGGLVLLLGLVALARRRLSGEWAGFVSLAVTLSWLATEAIKFFYHSPRPFVILLDRSFPVTYGGVDSFPSGHAAVFFALALAVATRYPHLGQGLAVAALLVSLGRVGAGWHWPSDILGGAVVAFLVVWGLRLALNFFRQGVNRYN
jgi:membrane-associated phospholipid phosphatase